MAAEVENRFGAAVQLLWLGAESGCDLPRFAHHFTGGQGWSWVAEIAPDELAWFLVENWWRGTPRCYVFEARPTMIQQVLGNAHGFEYIIASRRFDWLIAEEHHSVVQAVGNIVADKLRQFVTYPGGRG